MTNMQNAARMSRRQMIALTSLGVAGIAGGVFHHTSRAENGASEKGCEGVRAATSAELRAAASPEESQLYLNRDLGAHYYFDPSDTTTADNGRHTIVSHAGHRFKLLPSPFQTAVHAQQYNASGSAQATTGSISAGSQQLTVADPADFEVGQGILIAGAGNIQLKEVITLVIEEDAWHTGAVQVQLPGEAVQSVDVTAVHETIELTVTAGCAQSGQIALLLDQVEFLLPVEAGETAVQIADRIRGSFFERWAISGSSGTDTVTLTYETPGVRNDSFFYAQGTGVQIGLQAVKGARTTKRDIAAQLKGKSFQNWKTGGYNKSNVVFFIAKNQGAMGGEHAEVQFGATGVTGRMEVVQYGASMVTTITAINGSTITLQTTALHAASDVYVGHDDTAALSQALAAAAGNVLVIPEGTYLMSDSLQVPAGTTVRGAGKQSTILQFQMLRKPGIVVANESHHVYIGQLQLKNICAPDAYYNGSDTEIYGINILGAQGTTVEHCWLDNCDDSGIRVGYTGTTLSSGTRLLHNMVKNTSEGAGIEVIRGEDCLMIGNYIKDCSQHAVRLCGARKPIVIGNTVESSLDGFNIQGFGNGLNVTQRTQDFIIEGNVIKEPNGPGILLSSQSNSGLIANNWLESTQGQIGVNVITSVVKEGQRRTTSDVTIQGNIIKGFNRAISIRGDQNHIVVRGNTIKNYSGPTSAFGVYLDCDDVGDLINIVIEGNTFLCRARDKSGITLFRPSLLTKVVVHRNTFIMRSSDPSQAQMAARYIKNAYTSGYNADALESTISGTCELNGATGVTSHNTNVFIALPV